MAVRRQTAAPAVVNRKCEACGKNTLVAANIPPTACPACKTPYPKLRLGFDTIPGIGA